MTFVGLVVPADGTQPYRMTFGDEPDQRPQKIVGGYIELIQGPLGVAGYCNEEGKLLNLPINRRASMFFRAPHPHGPGWDDIRGDVVLFDNMRPALETADEGDAPEWLDDRI
jgi:hypothetical protein